MAKIDVFLKIMREARQEEPSDSAAPGQFTATFEHFSFLTWRRC